MDKEAKELGDKFMGWINSGSHGADTFAALVVNAHPTLQQRAMVFFLRCIQTWAKKDLSFVDARNEATVKLCKSIVEKFGEEFCLPFI